jgi:hypothetical protein
MKHTKFDIKGGGLDSREIKNMQNAVLKLLTKSMFAKQLTKYLMN